MRGAKLLAFGGTLALLMAFVLPVSATEARSSTNYKSKWQARVCKAVERSEIRAWNRFDQDSRWRTKAVQNRINLQNRIDCDSSATVAEAITERKSQFSTLLAAVDTAGLVPLLADEAKSFTVFAPTNEAFEDLLAALGATPEQLLANPELGSILAYHVLGAEVGSSTAVSVAQSPEPSDRTVTTFGGLDITLDLRSDGLYVNNSKVVVTDIQTGNGVIHVLDTVLSPADAPTP